jgi:hypothetical protein
MMANNKLKVVIGFLVVALVMALGFLKYVKFVSLLGLVLFLASVALSIACLLKRPGYSRRWLPCISIILLPFIELVPESGWSDIRSQWHAAVFGLVWSVWDLCVVSFFLQTRRDALLIALRIAFAGIGIFVLTGCVIALVRSWMFLHSPVIDYR